MAERTVTLTLTTQEEKSLAKLIGILCRMEQERGELSCIMGLLPEGNNPSVQAIGRINAALNADRA